MTMPGSACFYRRLAAAVVVATWLIGCGGGGSGSSGFDAAFSENAAITQALNESHCVERKGLSICPADVTSPQGAPGSVETGLDQSGSVPCASAGDGACSFNLPFMPQGFPAATIFQVASRAVNPDTAWQLSGGLQQNGSPGGSEFDVPVQSPSAQPGTTPSAEIQIAVLVFPHAPQAPLPTTAGELSAFGADSVFVTRVLTPNAPPP